MGPNVRHFLVLLNISVRTLLVDVVELLMLLKAAFFSPPLHEYHQKAEVKMLYFQSWMQMITFVQCSLLAREEPAAYRRWCLHV